MLCEKYRSAITDAVVGGIMPPEVQAHLQSCEACGVAFAEEKKLFNLMDEALCNTANAMVPPSLAPRARAAIAQEPISYPRLRTVWLWAPALVAASLLLVVLLPRLLHDSQSGGGRVIVVAPPLHLDNSDKTNQATVSSTEQPVRNVQRRSTSHPAILRVSQRPQVVVPRDSEAAVLRYAAVLRQRVDLGKSLAALDVQKPAKIEPLEIAQIHSDPLAIDPLAPEEPGEAP